MSARVGILAFALLSWTVGALGQPAPAGETYDVLITGGQVLDGTGNPGMFADVAIRAGRIVELGKRLSGRARRTIDAKGRIVCPGFIDMHSHADRGLLSEDRRRRGAPNLVTQGDRKSVV